MDERPCGGGDKEADRRPDGGPAEDIEPEPEPEANPCPGCPSLPCKGIPANARSLSISRRSPSHSLVLASNFCCSTFIAASLDLRAVCHEASSADKLESYSASSVCNEPTSDCIAISSFSRAALEAMVASESGESGLAVRLGRYGCGTGNALVPG